MYEFIWVLWTLGTLKPKVRSDDYKLKFGFIRKFWPKRFHQIDSRIRWKLHFKASDTFRHTQAERFVVISRNKFLAIRVDKSFLVEFYVLCIILGMYSKSWVHTDDFVIHVWLFFKIKFYSEIHCYHVIGDHVMYVCNVCR
jgi:hypothetical protein